MKNIILFALVLLVSFSTYAQQLDTTNYVVLEQTNVAYPGFQAKTYRGLFPVGHGQFKMFNYGGTPGNLTELGENETLGSFVFNGYDGSQNVISAVIQAKTIKDSRDPRFNFLLSNGIGNQRPNRMTIIGETGNVGIGVTDPKEKMDIDGNIRMRDGAVAGYIPVSDENGKMTWTDPTSVAGVHHWTESGSDVYRTDGFVGIGTDAPSAPLDIEGGIGSTLNLNTTSGSSNYISFNVDGNYKGYAGIFNGEDDMDFGTGAGNNTGSTHLVTNSIPRLTVSADGKVGINDTNPFSTYLSVETDESYNFSAIIGRSNYVSNGISNSRGVYGNSTQLDGFGFGTVGYGGAIGVLGNGYGGDHTGAVTGVRGYATGSGGVRYGIHGLAEGGTTNYAGYFQGDVTVTGVFNNPSDRKLKENVKSYTDALEVIQQLEIKTYDYKKGEFAGMGLPEKPQIGFIAQEVEEILPNLVTTNVHPEEIKYEKDGSETFIREEINYKGINYIGLIPILTQGMKELHIENQELKSSNNDLEVELTEVKKQLSKLTELINDKFKQMEEDMSSCCLSDINDRTENTNLELNGSDIPTLEQNNPNPFYEQTIIKYYIPSLAKTATMTITDMKGSPIKSVNLTNTGLGTITINAHELPVGTYVYTLFVNGKQVESKQMILVR